jgi:hypothetical protein
VNDAGELVVSRWGRPIARILPVSRRRPWPDHADLRGLTPRVGTRFATFLDELAAGFLSLCLVDDPRFDEAVGLIARYPEYPLRTLNALHLAVARHAQGDAISTADSVTAETAQAMGFAVARF